MREFNYKKNILARTISAVLLSLPLVLSVIILILMAPKSSEMDYIINIISLAFLIFFIIIEVFLLLKSIKKDLMIMSLIYNSNDTINTGALIITNIILFISLGVEIASIIVFFISKNIDLKNACLVLIPMCLYVFINTIIYDLYILIYRFKKFEITDLA